MIYLLFTWILAPLAWLRLWRRPRSSPPQKILLIQTAKIGDYICTTPLIRSLRTRYPQACLCVLVHPTIEPLAKHQPEVDRVFTLENGRIRGFNGRLKLYRLIRHESFDTTVCISPNQAFLLLPFLAGVRWRGSILPNFGGRSFRLAAPFLSASETHRQGRQMVETGMALLRRLDTMPDLPNKSIVPAPGAAERITLALPSLTGERWIGLGVSSGNKLKELGTEQLAELTDRLLDLGAGVVLIGSAADQQVAGELHRTRRSSRLVDSTGKVALEDLAALLDRLSLYVGVDSGITYLADARRIPVIDIMGPADPEDQRPTGPQAIIIRTDLACAPCSHAFLAPYHCAIKTRECVANAHLTQIVSAAGKLVKTVHPGQQSK